MPKPDSMPKINCSINPGIKQCLDCNSKLGKTCKNKACNDLPQGVTAAAAAFITDGLGKATMRGVKRCPKCGRLNGSKSGSCKNKSCNAVFKDAAARKRTLEVCKLDTGSFTRVYSVRAKDRGPDNRGFVHLPLENTDILNSSALCFVDHCQGNFKTKVLQCHEQEGDSLGFGGICSHIEAAERCTSHSTPLPVNLAIVEAMALSQQMKEDIWALVSSCASPSVQRVSRDTLAVKCSVNTKFPLGYLHTTFVAGRSDQDLQFSCPCSMFRESARSVASNGRCVHFYACICAFVNQESLRQEFDSYIKLEIALGNSILDDENIYIPTGEEGREQTELEMLFDCHVEIMEDSMSGLLSDVAADNSMNNLPLSDSLQPLHDPDNDCAILTDDALQAAILAEPPPEPETLQTQNHTISSILGTIDTNGRCIISEHLPADAIIFSTDAFDETQPSNFCLSSQKVDSPVQQDSMPLDLQDESALDVGLKNFMPLYLEAVEDEPPFQPKPKLKKGGVNRPQQSFLEWLAAITESINQQMHYELPGKQNTLIFQTPKKFFDKLKERINLRTRKKKIAGTKTLTRRTTIPFGNFYKYSWTLDNRFQVKAIFDTRQVPLRLVQSYVRKDDGTFQLAEENVINDDTPLYKTYLRVAVPPGTPFVIEWMPDILPVSQVGELKLIFEFGHVPNLL